METVWNTIANFLSFTGVQDITVWQDIALGIFFIPLSIEIGRSTAQYLNNKRPIQMLLSEFVQAKESLLIFLSQLSAVDDNGRIIVGQKYAIRTPNPLPSIKNMVKLHFRQNIDPVWSEGDGGCLSEIYNVLGRAGRKTGFSFANILQNWDDWSKPTITIGFNPKTEKYMEKCFPMYFKVKNGKLSIKGSKVELDSYIPSDAAIIQKTYIKESKIPVLILAGLGTLGTHVAGYYFNKNADILGKIYGKNPFCLLLSVKVDEGKESVRLEAAYPKPKLTNIIFNPITYIRLKLQGVFPK